MINLPQKVISYYASSKGIDNRNCFNFWLRSKLIRVICDKPFARGDVLIEALNIIRNAIINHIHGYSGLPADKVALENLEKINFDAILQKNIVIN